MQISPVGEPSGPIQRRDCPVEYGIQVDTLMWNKLYKKSDNVVGVKSMRMFSEVADR